MAFEAPSAIGPIPIGPTSSLWDASPPLPASHSGPLTSHQQVEGVVVGTGSLKTALGPLFPRASSLSVVHLNHTPSANQLAPQRHLSVDRAKPKNAKLPSSRGVSVLQKASEESWVTCTTSANSYNAQYLDTQAAHTPRGQGMVSRPLKKTPLNVSVVRRGINAALACDDPAPMSASFSEDDLTPGITTTASVMLPNLEGIPTNLVVPTVLVAPDLSSQCRSQPLEEEAFSPTWSETDRPSVVYIGKAGTGGVLPDADHGEKHTLVFLIFLVAGGFLLDFAVHFGMHYLLADEASESGRVVDTISVQVACALASALLLAGYYYTALHKPARTVSWNRTMGKSFIAALRK